MTRPIQNWSFLNDGAGHFKIGGTYGDPKWPTRNAAVGDLNDDGYPDIAVANRAFTSYVCFNDGKLHFQCDPLRDTPSAASVRPAVALGPCAETLTNRDLLCVKARG